MAPDPKVTRKQIIDAGLEIARERGIEAITARELGNKLGLSSSPAYSYFSSIDEIKEEVVKKIYEILTEVLSQKNGDADVFLNVGLNYIKFAQTQKELYQIIHSSGRKYANEHVQTVEDMMIDNLRKEKNYAGLSKGEMKDLYLKMSIFAHGLADLIYQDGREKYTNSIIRKILSETGEALINNIRKKTKGETL